MGNLTEQIDTCMMKVGNAEWSSYRSPANYFIGVRVHQPFYFARTRMLRHLILGIVVKFPGIYAH